MIIGFDGSRAFTDKKTGTENYSYQLLKVLAKIDRENIYKVYLRPGALINLTDWPGNFQFSVLNFQFLWTQVGLGLQTFIDKLDVLFVPAHTLPMIRKPGLKTVVTVHDLGSEYLPGMHQLKQRLYLGIMQRYQLKTASRIIAVSEATKQDLVEKIGLNPKKIIVAHEGYDKSLYRKLPIDTIVNRLNHYNLKPRLRRGSPSAANIYYLFVGTVQPRKNLERVIEAFAEISSKENANLVIAGSKGWLSDEIYKLPKKLGIENQVKFLGYVQDEDLPALYAGATAFVYPSLFEGFGLPILEAQACGCPVITSSLSSMPEVVGSGAVLVNPYSVEEIAGAMKRVKREGERGKLVKNGLKNVKRFSWEKCARETLEILQSAI